MVTNIDTSLKSTKCLVKKHVRDPCTICHYLLIFSKSFNLWLSIHHSTIKKLLVSNLRVFLWPSRVHMSQHSHQIVLGRAFILDQVTHSCSFSSHCHTPERRAVRWLVWSFRFEHSPLGFHEKGRAYEDIRQFYGLLYSTAIYRSLLHTHTWIQKRAKPGIGIRSELLAIWNKTSPW